LSAIYVIQFYAKAKAKQNKTKDPNISLNYELRSPRMWGFLTGKRFISSFGHFSFHSSDISENIVFGLIANFIAAILRLLVTK
jgi:hypothetical protein